jgi:hypothetical protein
MEFNFSHLELEELQEMHQKEVAELNNRLINGALWSEVSGQKEKVTKIAIAIHNKLETLKLSTQVKNSCSPDDQSR